MLDLGDNRWLVQDPSELPQWFNADELFLDVETKRVFDHKDHGGMYPWKGDRIAGVALSIDHDPKVLYVPVRHTRTRIHKNIPEQVYQAWLKRVLGGAKKWINHNVIFDAIFAHFDGAEFGGELWDTLTLSKIHDSDRMGHGLKELCRDWVDFDIQEGIIKALLKQLKTKSYADLPTDTCGRYACNDVRGNRLLYRFLQQYIEPGVDRVWTHEAALTPVLFDMEIGGLATDYHELQIDHATCGFKKINLETKIAEFVGREFKNHHTWYKEVLLNQLGYPVLATKYEKGVDSGNPTFDKEAMALYAIHPKTLGDPELADLFKNIMEYRQEAQHHGLFVIPFMLLRDEKGMIHPRYNQVVRTGRMSASRPNSQQNNKRSKRLLHPRDGYGFISCDYSQIEFRLIVHFIKDLAAIAAYAKDPWTDFHQWVADMVGIDRKPGKTMNFRIGYGAGKHNVETALVKEPVIIEAISHTVNEMIAAGEAQPNQQHDLFRKLCAERAAEIYDEYHETLPGIKSTSKLAERKAKQRGFIFNPHGRRRHLPRNQAHKAFNSLVQGEAMDIIKERMVALSPRYNQRIRELDIRIVANVHDEILFEAPLDVMYDPAVHAYLIEVLESPSITYRVPIKCGLGISSQNWAIAAGDDQVEVNSHTEGKLRG